jgi:hypothetical protein
LVCVRREGADVDDDDAARSAYVSDHGAQCLGWRGFADGWAAGRDVSQAAVELGRNVTVGPAVHDGALPCTQGPRAYSSPSDSPASRMIQPTASWPQKGGELLRGRTAACVDRALAVPDELLRQRPQPTKERFIPKTRQRLLGEDQRAGERPRRAQLGAHDPAAAGLAVADRDRLAHLKEVELQQLSGPIGRPLISAPRQVTRAQLAQVVVEDRLEPS